MIFDAYIVKTCPSYILSKYDRLRTASGYILLCGAVIKEVNKDVARRILEDIEFQKSSEKDVVLQDYAHQLVELLK